MNHGRCGADGGHPNDRCPCNCRPHDSPSKRWVMMVMLVTVRCHMVHFRPVVMGLCEAAEQEPVSGGENGHAGGRQPSAHLRPDGMHCGACNIPMRQCSHRSTLFAVFAPLLAPLRAPLCSAVMHMLPIE